MTPKKTAYGKQKDKLEASRSRYYEWRMLNEIAPRIRLYENKDMVIYNALIEAFCAHLRNFIEFFHRKKRRPFWSDFLPPNKNILLKHKLDKYESKVNDLLSHCTYKRLNYTGTEKEWHIDQIVGEVNENMFKFIDAADQNLLCDKIKKYKNILESSNLIYDKSSTHTSSDNIGKSQIIKHDEYGQR